MCSLAHFLFVQIALGFKCGHAPHSGGGYCLAIDIIGDVSGIPDRLADDSGWFPTKGGGGPRGSELPIRMLEEAKRRLRPMGRLFLPTGTLQDEAAIIQRARALYGRVKALTNRPIPLPSQLAASATLKDLIDRKIVTVTRRGSRLLWKAQVWELSPES